MNATLMNWVLGGALIASVAVQYTRQPAPGDGAGTASYVRCDALAPDRIGMTPEQVAALESACRESCGDVRGLQAEIRTRTAALEALLRAEPVDAAAARALAAELGELRERAVVGCVDAVLAVREVLDRTQLDALLDCCKTNCAE
jgi:Spy/CpxP family protein refolding chaperone